jgi:hypothetical protein
VRKCDRTPVLNGMMRRLLIEGRLAEAREVLKALMYAVDEHERPDYETRCKAFQGILAIDRPSVLATPKYG